MARTCVLSRPGVVKVGNAKGTSAPSPIAQQPAKTIPFDQLGAEAQKQYTGDGISITPTATSARLRAVMSFFPAPMKSPSPRVLAVVLSVLVTAQSALQ